MTASPIGSLGTTTLLTTLAQAANNAVQMSTKVEVDQVDGRIQRQLNQKLAALKSDSGGDAAFIQFTQSQVDALQKHLSSINTASNQYFNNGGLLSDIQNQLAAMQTAAQNGNGTGFDQALQAANDYLGNLTVINPTAPFQPDKILPLKASGFGIGSSATYNLATPSGKTAAEAAVTNAQTLVNQIFAVTTSNQLIANSMSTALTTQINSLNSTLQQTQTTDELNTASQSATLTQQAQDQEHLIELALGNTTLLSSALQTMANPPQVSTSPYDVLLNSVGATPASESAQQPAILSLLT